MSSGHSGEVRMTCRQWAKLNPKPMLLSPASRIGNSPRENWAATLARHSGLWRPSSAANPEGRTVRLRNEDPYPATQLASRRLPAYDASGVGEPVPAALRHPHDGPALCRPQDVDLC